MTSTIKLNKKKFEKLLYIFNPWLRNPKASNYGKICNIDYGKKKETNKEKIL